MTKRLKNKGMTVVLYILVLVLFLTSSVAAQCRHEVIPQGTKLYHGTIAGFLPANLLAPAWLARAGQWQFSVHAAARNYMASTITLRNAPGLRLIPYDTQAAIPIVVCANHEDLGRHMIANHLNYTQPPTKAQPGGIRGAQIDNAREMCGNRNQTDSSGTTATIEGYEIEYDTIRREPEVILCGAGVARLQFRAPLQWTLRIKANDHLIVSGNCPDGNRWNCKLDYDSFGLSCK